MKKRLISMLVAIGVGGQAVASVLAGSAAAYPPYTCGTVSANSKSYIVRSHGPTCGFALKGTSRYLRTHQAPHGFRCTESSGSVGLDCVSHRSKYRYFLATTS